MNRRQVLTRTGLALGATAFAVDPPARSTFARRETDSLDWETVRDRFNLAPDLIHMAGLFLASHPTPVREAIERHRRGLDEDPIGYYHAGNDRFIGAALLAAADYLAADPMSIALTDSTTMGLGLLYGGLSLDDGQDILTTVHDFYATTESLELRAEQTGTTIRATSLYDDPATASVDEIVSRLVSDVGPQTRIVAITWVHSGTGVKLPVGELAAALGEINGARAEGERALLCVDGVHGLGVEDVTVADLGCDFLVAGCHKWLFGPRGTGIVWGAERAWPAAIATIPTFDVAAYQTVADGRDGTALPLAAPMTPGGFHSFEHRWALAEAFRFHLSIGKPDVAARIRSLNDQLKDGLAAMLHVRLRTPRSPALSAGITCFEVDGLTPQQVVVRLRERKFVASVTPYATSYVRLAPGLLNSPEEVDAVLTEVASLAAA